MFVSTLSRIHTHTCGGWNWNWKIQCGHNAIENMKYICSKYWVVCHNLSFTLLLFSICQYLCLSILIIICFSILNVYDACFTIHYQDSLLLFYNYFVCWCVSAELNDVRFSAYRTAMKLRTVQKKLRCEFLFHPIFCSLTVSTLPAFRSCVSAGRMLSLRNLSR